MTSNRLSDLAGGTPLQNWIVLGPFVVKTSGHFEREYLYERDRILDIDYLASEGGETDAHPVVGQSVENIGLGPKYLTWQEYPFADLHGMRIAGEIIYETVQRNCAIYAATIVDSESAVPALFDAVHSGMKLWVNGDLVCNEPYGRSKGLRAKAPSKLIQLRKGRNLILVKFRPGFIADGVDFCVREVQISPLVAEAHLPVALGRVRPTPYFRGTVEEPRQMIEAAVVNTSHEVVKAKVCLESSTLKGQDCEDVLCDPESVTTVRLTLPTPRGAAGKPVRAEMSVRVYGRELKVPLEYQAAMPPLHDGVGMMLTAFHFDTTYHEEQRVYAMGAFDIVRDYCRMHRRDPNFASTISEVDYLKPYFDVFPEDRETLMKMFREKRSNPDVMYNQPNEQNCGGEALVRNFLYGQLFHGRVLGDICHCYGPGDVFGHPNQISQIARKSGCIGLTWDKYIFNFPPFFNHLSLDASCLPHKRGDATWAEVNTMGLSVKTVQRDQTPPTDWHGTLLPKVRQATYFDLMSTIHEQVEEREAHLPVTSRDFSLYHAATAMSRINLKIANRLGESLLLTAERFATVANLLGASYPEKALDKAWRQILCGQHHDSITGTHNEISYVDLMNSYREVLELGSDVLNRTLDYLGRAIDAGGAKHPLVVFNPLGWERTDVVQVTVRPKGMKSFTVQDHAGKNVPFEVVDVERDKKGAVASATVRFVGRKMPSMGYRAYQLVEAKKALPEVKASAGVDIENDFYRIQVDPERGGGMVSLYDKKAKREVLNTKTHHVANELACLEEVPDREETQHEFYTTGLKLFSGEQPASVEVEKGPLSATLRIRYKMAEICGVVQEITLTKGVQRIDFRTVLADYQGEDNLFCVTFPTSLKGAVPVFDERFGVVTRNASRGYLDFRTHRQLIFSDAGVYAANKWMEYGKSAVVQMGRNKYALGMVGLITPNEKADILLAEELQRILVKKGVTCTPWFDEKGPYWGSYKPHMDEDLFNTMIRFSLGSRGRNKYTKKLLAAQPAKVRKEFAARVKKDGHAFLFLKDGNFFEGANPEKDAWPPVPVLIVEAKSNEALSKALEGLMADFPTTACIKLPANVDVTGDAHPMDDYGLAVLNEGTYANSVEKDGVICMMLAHTCRWYGGTNNFPEGYLVPENKNHVFRYALYPHAGDWREAGTQQVGHAFNYPLIARETRPAAKPALPPEEALLSIEPANVILAAMKPLGNPIPGFEKDAVCDASKGIILRMYDTEGVDSEARITFASGIRAAWTANFLEEKEGDLAVRDEKAALYVPPFSIETVGIVPNKLGRKMGGKALGPEAEPVQPVWVRSWEHDSESMPMGYEPVVCSISRKVVEEDEGRTLRITVNAVNDYTDASVAGSARLLMPAGWTAEPAEISYEIEPLGHQGFEVKVTRPEPGAAGQIKLRYEDDGQTFQDVLEIEECFDLQMEVENRGDVIAVKLSNPTRETVEGEVSMVTPLETWSCEEVGAYSLLDISPRTQGISLQAGGTQVLEFRVKSTAATRLVEEASYWAVAKLMSNGRITLKRCDRTPARRMMHHNKWFDDFRKRRHEVYGLPTEEWEP